MYKTTANDIMTDPVMSKSLSPQTSVNIVLVDRSVLRSQEVGVRGVKCKMGHFYFIFCKLAGTTEYTNHPISLKLFCCKNAIDI